MLSGGERTSPTRTFAASTLPWLLLVSGCVNTLGGDAPPAGDDDATPVEGDEEDTGSGCACSMRPPTGAAASGVDILALTMVLARRKAGY